MKIKVLSERIRASIGEMRLTAKVASERIVALVEAGAFGILQKILADTSKAIDTLVKALSKPFADASTATEATAKEVGKTTSDSGSATDSTSLNPNLGKSDATATSDTNIQSVGKNPSDSSVTSETQSFDIDYHLSDNPTATDDLDGIVGTADDPAKTIGKSVTEVINISDALAKATITSASDSAYGSESASSVKAGGSVPQDDSAISDAAVIDLSKYLTDLGLSSDSPVLAIDKPFSDGGVSTDTEVKSINKDSSDSASSTDSGTLIAQNYVDNNGYFDDDYVGVKRTF